MDFIGSQFELSGRGRILRVPPKTVSVPSTIRVEGDDVLLNSAFALAWLGFSHELISETGFSIVQRNANKDENDEGASRQYIGPEFRWEMSGFWPTVIDEIFLGHNMDSDNYTLSLMDTLGMSDLANRDPRELSGGETAKVILMAHLVRRPSFLVIDRVLDELDFSVRMRLLDKLKDVIPGGIVAVVGNSIGSKCEYAVSTDFDEIKWITTTSSFNNKTESLEAMIGDFKIRFFHHDSSGLELSRIELDGFQGVRPAGSVFEPVNCKFVSGDLIFATGANGCGKTTFIEALAGLLPSKGRMSLQSDGKKLHPQQFFAFAPQDPRCDITETSVEQELILASQDHEYVPNLLLELGAPRKILNASINDDIGLQKITSVIASTLRGKPCCLLDEPTLYLNREFKRIVCSAINRYLSQGGIVICSSHDIEFVESFIKDDEVHMC